MQQDSEKRNKLRELLLSLAKSQEALQDATARSKIYLQLEEIYHTRNEEKQFRHYYSEILSLLISISQDENLGNIEILGQNLRVIFNGYQPKNHDADNNPIDISDSIRKLYDHVNLEIQRINYSDMNDGKLLQEETINTIRDRTIDISRKAEEISGRVVVLESKLSQTQDEYKAIQEKTGGVSRKADEISGRVETVESKLTQTQKEYVAILGIFAAIVLAFTGGFAFSTSVLENLHSGSIYRVVLVALIIGLVIVNILFGLFFYLDRLISTKTEKRIAPLIIANIVLVILIIATVFAWSNRFVEKRNLPSSSSSTGTNVAVTTTPSTTSNP